MSQRAQKAASGVHSASISVYIRIDLAEDPPLSARFSVDCGARPRKALADPSLGDETGRTHHLPAKSLILRAKAHDFSHLQIISLDAALLKHSASLQAAVRARFCPFGSREGSKETRCPGHQLPN
jgi:hypothetical protein